MRAVVFLLCVVAWNQVSGVPLKAKIAAQTRRITVELPNVLVPVHQSKPDIDIDCNTLVDSMLEELDPEISDQGYDPYDFVSEDFLDIADVTGQLFGLSTLARSGNCSMTLGTTTTLTFELSVSALEADIALTLFDIYEASADAEFDTVRVAITADGTLPDGPFEVDTFDIDYLSDCNILITGLGIFDYLADLLADGLCDLLDGLIADLLDGTIKDMINNILGNLSGEKSAIHYPRLANQKVGSAHRVVIPSRRH